MKERDLAMHILTNIGAFSSISAIAKGLSLDRHNTAKLIHNAGVVPALGRKYWYEDVAKALAEG